MYKTIVAVRRNYVKPLLALQKMSTTISDNPIECSINKKLKDSLQPSYIQVINESHQHRVPQGAETHFKIIVASDMFKNKSRLESHRMIHALLQEEFSNGLHSITIVARTPSKEINKDDAAPSPGCLGGYGK